MGRRHRYLFFLPLLAGLDALLSELGALFCKGVEVDAGKKASDALFGLIISVGKNLALVADELLNFFKPVMRLAPNIAHGRLQSPSLHTPGIPANIGERITIKRDRVDLQLFGRFLLTLSAKGRLSFLARMSAPKEL